MPEAEEDEPLFDELPRVVTEREESLQASGDGGQELAKGDREADSLAGGCGVDRDEIKVADDFLP